jgi:prepilin-type N-terminal cleavage/methylation domain-containing protein
MKLIHRLRPKRGFTLIELIMTIVVVGIVAVPLSLFIGRNIESVFYCEDLTIALNLAKFEMEKVNNLTYANIINASLPNYQGYNYNVARTVTYVQGSGATPESLKKITVSVTKTGSASVLLSLVTYIARNVSYGL